MPELFGLLLQSRDKMGMGVAKRVDRDAGGKIQVSFAVDGGQPGTLAPLENQIRPCVVREQSLPVHYSAL